MTLTDYRASLEKLLAEAKEDREFHRNNPGPFGGSHAHFDGRVMAFMWAISELNKVIPAGGSNEFPIRMSLYQAMMLVIDKAALVAEDPEDGDRFTFLRVALSDLQKEWTKP